MQWVSETRGTTTDSILGTLTTTRLRNAGKHWFDNSARILEHWLPTSSDSEIKLLSNYFRFQCLSSWINWRFKNFITQLWSDFNIWLLMPTCFAEWFSIFGSDFSLTSELYYNQSHFGLSTYYFDLNIKFYNWWNFSLFFVDFCIEFGFMWWT